MSKLLKESWLVIVLAVTFGMSLAAVETSLRPRIKANEAGKLARAIYEVIPGGDSSKELKLAGLEVHRVFDESGRTIGWAYSAEAMGYADKVRVLIGLDATGERISGVQILRSIETPGLGDRVKGAEFRDPFRDKRTDEAILLLRGDEKADNGVDVVTGATYSSIAVVEAVNVKREAVRDAIRELLASEATSLTTQPER